jgi:hypothetical protein
MSTFESDLSAALVCVVGALATASLAVIAGRSWRLLVLLGFLFVAVVSLVAVLRDPRSWYSNFPQHVIIYLPVFLLLITASCLSVGKGFVAALAGPVLAVCALVAAAVFTVADLQALCLVLLAGLSVSRLLLWRKDDQPHLPDPGPRWGERAGATGDGPAQSQNVQGADDKLTEGGA